MQGAETRLRIDQDGAFIINSSGIDRNTVIRGNGNDNLLFVDAGNDRVGVGGSPSSTFHVQSGTENNVATFTSTDSTATIMLQDDTGNAQFGTTGSTARISPNSSYAVLEASQTAVVLNNASQDTDFRVESDSETNMLLVDAGTNKVGIATSAPRTELDVDGDIGLPSGMHIAREGVVTGATSVTQRYVFTHTANNNWGSCVIDYAVTGTVATSSSQNYKRGLITFTKYSADATPMRNIVYTDIVAGSGITVSVSNTSTTQFTVDFSFSSGATVNRHIGSTIDITAVSLELTAVSHSVF